MKTWNGPTPDNNDWRYARGYVDAMNSPEVRAMYEELKRSMGVGGEKCECKGHKAIRVYELGIKEEIDDN